jgi:hypothetical protein
MIFGAPVTILDVREEGRANFTDLLTRPLLTKNIEQLLSTFP